MNMSISYFNKLIFIISNKILPIEIKRIKKVKNFIKYSINSLCMSHRKLFQRRKLTNSGLYKLPRYKL